MLVEQMISELLKSPSTEQTLNRVSRKIALYLLARSEAFVTGHRALLSETPPNSLLGLLFLATSI
jgi:hypothetical protein